MSAQTLAQEYGLTHDQAQALFSRGFDLLDSGEFDAAAAVFVGLTVLNPHDAAAFAAHGAVLQLQGNFAAAEAACDTALKLDGAAALARVNRGVLRLRRGDGGGREDLEVAARTPSPVQRRAQQLLRFYAR